MKLITIYWSSDDRNNSGWAVKSKRDDGTDESGPIGIDSDASLDDAIDQACHKLDVALDHNDFCREQLEDGGFAVWAAA